MECVVNTEQEQPALGQAMFLYLSHFVSFGYQVLSLFSEKIRELESNKYEALSNNDALLLWFSCCDEIHRSIISNPSYAHDFGQFINAMFIYQQSLNKVVGLPHE